ncbi:MAG TPA: YciI family protein [Candidatus Kapabacteria bacterium]|nr:YciI family protein [Candidatus Kapabacteria bacterium]
MKEFMILIHNDIDKDHGMSAEKYLEFLNAVSTYIEGLIKNGNLVGAQPLLNEGAMISGRPGSFKDGPFIESKEVIVGYYHILAADLDEAIAIAKGNPELSYKHTVNARIQVRPIKTLEEKINFTYPKGK